MGPSVSTAVSVPVRSAVSRSAHHDVMVRPASDANQDQKGAPDGEGSAPRPRRPRSAEPGGRRSHRFDRIASPKDLAVGTPRELPSASRHIVGRMGIRGACSGSPPCLCCNVEKNAGARKAALHNDGRACLLPPRRSCATPRELLRTHPLRHRTGGPKSIVSVRPIDRPANATPDNTIKVPAPAGGVEHPSFEGH